MSSVIAPGKNLISAGVLIIFDNSMKNSDAITPDTKSVHRAKRKYFVIEIELIKILYYK